MSSDAFQGCLNKNSHKEACICILVRNLIEDNNDKHRVVTQSFIRSSLRYSTIQHNKKTSHHKSERTWLKFKHLTGNGVETCIILT